MNRWLLVAAPLCCWFFLVPRARTSRRTSPPRTPAGHRRRRRVQHQPRLRQPRHPGPRATPTVAAATAPAAAAAPSPSRPVPYPDGGYDPSRSQHRPRRDGELPLADYKCFEDVPCLQCVPRPAARRRPATPPPARRVRAARRRAPRRPRPPPPRRRPRPAARVRRTAARAAAARAAAARYRAWRRGSWRCSSRCWCAGRRPSHDPAIADGVAGDRAAVSGLGAPAPAPTRRRTSRTKTPAPPRVTAARASWISPTALAPSRTAAWGLRRQRHLRRARHRHAGRRRLGLLHRPRRHLLPILGPGTCSVSVDCLQCLVSSGPPVAATQPDAGSGSSSGCSTATAAAPWLLALLVPALVRRKKSA